jgi:hypothetical protein
VAGFADCRSRCFRASTWQACDNALRERRHRDPPLTRAGAAGRCREAGGRDPSEGGSPALCPTSGYHAACAGIEIEGVLGKSGGWIVVGGAEERGLRAGKPQNSGVVVSVMGRHIHLYTYWRRFRPANWPAFARLISPQHQRL